MNTIGKTLLSNGSIDKRSFYRQLSYYLEANPNIALEFLQ